MKNILFITAFTFMFSCQDDDNQNSLTNISTNINIKVIDSSNQDLLNTEFQNISKDLQIYYEENGQWVKYNEPNLDYPNGYRIFKKDNQYILAVYPKTFSNLNKTKSILKWKEYSSDTIINEYKKLDNSIYNDKIYINGNQLWSVNTAKTDIITLIK